MSTVELIAALCGFFAVWLTIARSVWCWPVGLVQVALYIFVFWHARLYSDVLLHAVYVGLQIYGWQQWSRRSAREAATERVVVRRLGIAALAGCALLTLGGSAALGSVMHRYTDAALPFGDAFTTVASLVAQVLLARRFLASWYFWIAVDVVAVYVYWQKALMPTVVLYSVFLVMASIGLWRWWQVLARRESGAGASVLEGVSP